MPGTVNATTTTRKYIDRTYTLKVRDIVVELDVTVLAARAYRKAEPREDTIVLRVAGVAILLSLRA